ncbi:hypothetical protein BgAZ_110330 [Babesia gibsoni]|uniref:Uncharacterized protein n=1 Tax=Babesia gibsoni TaxID=33632 RepID=A0AAD8PH21_BABGI|nr:hypothetical protein BgAZ_110330 [Babesia gibsoni]
MGDSLNDEIELIRSFSLCESLDNLHRTYPTNEGAPATRITNEKIATQYDTIFMDPDDLDDGFFTSGAEPVPAEVDIAREEPVSQPSKELLQKIEGLEAQVRLLKAQNAQLIVNSCVLYNTLIKHIEKLRSELRDRDLAHPSSPL